MRINEKVFEGLGSFAEQTEITSTGLPIQSVDIAFFLSCTIYVNFVHKNINCLLQKKLYRKLKFFRA